MTYHPDKNPMALPPVRTVADVEKLPWGGNAWWDLPIINHVNRATIDETIPRDVRIKMAQRGGNMMTGENCDFTADYTFDDHVAQIKAEG